MDDIFSILSKIIDEEDENVHTLVVKYKADEPIELANMISHIGGLGGTGHSFTIVVDPYNKGMAKEFDWDGDGMDRILSVELDGEELDEKKVKY